MPVPAFRSAHHARLASGCWLGSTGWACLPTGFLRKVSVMFSYIAFSFPKLSWRRRFPLSMDGRQSVERALCLLNTCETDVDVAAGAPQRAMAQQILDQHQIGAGIEQVGGKTVPQAVRGGTGGQAGLNAGAVKNTPRRIERDRAGRCGAGKQPDARLGQAPVGTQHFEQAWRQDGQASLTALAGANVNDHALRIDVLDTQVADLAQTQAGGVARHEQSANLGLAKGSEESAQFGDGHGLSQRAGLTLGEGNAADFPGAAEGDAIEELEGGVHLAVAAIGKLLDLDLVQQKRADLGGTEFLR